MDNEPTPDGKIVNDSFSTCAPHVKASLGRLYRYDKDLRSFVNIATVILLIALAAVASCIVLFVKGHWVWVGVLALPALLSLIAIPACIYFIPLVMSRSKEVYYHALLTPGMVINQNPVKLACLGEISNGPDATYWGLKVIKVDALPVHQGRVNEVVPCVSTFTDGEHLDRWEDFTPKPLAWGTDSLDELNRCITKIGEEDVQMLKDLVSNKRYSQTIDELRLFDGDMKTL